MDKGTPQTDRRTKTSERRCQFAISCWLNESTSPRRLSLTERELGDLYGRFGFLVHRRCLVLLRSTAEADDMLQEVFLRVRRSSGPRKAGSELGWLYAVAANCCFTHLRRRGQEAGSPLSEREPTRQHGATPDDSDRRALLGTVLRRMEPKTREIGVLYYLGGLNHAELAAQTGLSPRTIGNRLRRFEERFRTLWHLAGGIDP